MKQLLFLLLFLPVFALAQQPPGLAWKRIYGGKKSETAHDVIPTYVGQILVVGETNSPPAQKQDGLAVLLTALGDTVFQKNYGGAGDDVLRAAVQTYDGNFVLAGHTTSVGAGKSDAWLLKINPQGDTLWQKTYGDTGDDVFMDIMQTTDGHLVAVGSTTHKGREDTWVCKLYEDGEIIWEKTFGNRGLDRAMAVVEGRDGNYGVAGITSSGKGSRNIWLFVLSPDSKPLHYQIFGARQWEEVYGLVATADGGYALAGYAKTDAKNQGAGLKDMWVIKTDEDTQEIWQRTYGGVGNDAALGIAETPDGGLVVAGYTFSHLMGANTPESMLIKVNGRDGKLLWEQKPPFGGSGSDELTAVTVMPDGSIVLAGHTDSKQEGAKSQDLWVIRMVPEYVPTTTLPTEVVIKNLQIKGIKNNTLTENDDAYLTFILANTGSEDAFDIDVSLLDKSNVEGLSYPKILKAGFLAKGQSKRISLPLRTKAVTKISTARLEVHYSDASRTRGKSDEIAVTVKPAEVPANFLQVEWVNPSVEESPGKRKQVKLEKVSIKVLARSDKPLKNTDFAVLVNGQPYQTGQKAGEAGLRPKNNERDAAGMYLYTFTKLITLAKGISDIEVMVDKDGKKQGTGKFKFEYDDQPNLHVIALGVEHDDLLFTTRDAQDFAASFQNQDGRIFDKVYMRTLVSGDSTKSGLAQTDGEVIKQAFADLKEKYNYTIYERDFLVLFISSHGRNVNNAFKIVPTDYILVGEKSLVDFQKDIIDQVDKIACNKLIFIDACQSGTIGVAEVSESTAENNAAVKPATADDKAKEQAKRAKVIADLSGAATGTNTLASCAANESSWEDKIWGNGAFTRAIIGAFKNEPYQDAAGTFRPSDDDDIITLGELYAYIARRVPQMIIDAGKQGAQNPFIVPAQLEKVKNVPIFKVKP